jgi:hyperosmotically inducible periplasmic protein
MKAQSFTIFIVAAILSITCGAVNAQSSDVPTAPITKTDKQQQRAANHALAKRVRAVLYKTKGLPTSGIVVLAKDGVVVLDGTVPEEGQVELAGKAAQSIGGVRSVENNVILAVRN